MTTEVTGRLGVPEHVMTTRIPNPHAAFVLVLVLAARAAPAATIGSESVLPLPSSALYGYAVNNRPADHETVSVNPPRFSWSYCPDASQAVIDVKARQFLFQLSTRPDFASTNLSVRTPWNFYNFLAPLPAGAEFYWRVGYLDPGLVRRERVFDHPVSPGYLIPSPQATNITHPTRFEDNSAATWEGVLGTDYTAQYPNSIFVLAGGNLITTGTNQHVRLQFETTDAYLTNWSEAVSWSPTRRFTIAGDAVRWDRSMLADPAYLAAKLSPHPHMLFSATNRAAIADWLAQCAQYFLVRGDDGTEQGAVGHGWNSLLADANQTLTSPWWPTSTNYDIYMFAVHVANVALAWQLTGNDRYTNGLAPAITTLADWWRQRFPEDLVVDTGANLVIQALGCGYDWAYDLLNSAQKQTCRNAVQVWLRAFLQGSDSAFYGAVNLQDAGARENGPWQVYWSSPAKHLAPHPVDSYHMLVPVALAFHAEVPEATTFFDLWVNWMIGVTYPWYADGVADNARGYTLVNLFGPGRALDGHLCLQATLPECLFNLNPWWQTNAEWWLATTPPGFTPNHGQWGRNGGFAVDPTWLSAGAKLARFCRSGRVAQAAAITQRIYGSASSIGATPTDLLYPYYFPLPAAQTNQATAAAFPEAGYAAASSRPVNTYEAWTNGVGIVFRARPAGHDWAYSYYDDLSFEIWAYGSVITDGGGNMWSQGYPAWANQGLLFGGVGPMQPGFKSGTLSFGSLAPYYGRLLAFTDRPEYTFFAGDASLAYAGGTLGSRIFSPVTNVVAQRLVLFPRKKYFVLLDVMSAPAPTTVQWVYQIMENTLTWDAVGIGFTYVSNSRRLACAYGDDPKVLAAGRNAPDVSVYVKHVAGGCRGEFRRGPDALINPYTGEDFSTDQNAFADLLAKTAQFSNVTNGMTIALTGAYPRVPTWLGQVFRYEDGTLNRWYGTRGVDYTLDADAHTLTITSAQLVTQSALQHVEVTWANRLRAGTVWVSSPPTTDFHFLSVIYPIKPGDGTPVVTPLDDYTVAVANAAGTERDVISFDPSQAARADFAVDYQAVSGRALPPPTPDLIAPVIVQAPRSLTAPPGRGFAFTAAASGGLPLTYQWRKDGQNLPGAPGPFYSGVVRDVADAGAYDVVVSNNHGAVTSAVARLTVVSPLAPPQNLRLVPPY
jgi:hypothetical protein